MPANPRILEKKGCSSKAWKELFAIEQSKKTPKIKKLELLIQNRINDGRTRNMVEYRTYAAIDTAFEVPFNQTTPTILQDLLSRKWDKPEDLLSSMEQWGLNVDTLFLKSTNEKGEEVMRLNRPTFYHTLVPLVKAYVTIRESKLFNERNTNPLLKFDPMVATAENRTLCEIITHVVQVMCADYGYSNVVKQAIHQTLMYSFCLMFPREAWHYEYQTVETEDGEKDQTEKEGIRYVCPHPTVVSWDLDYDICSFNSDTGCEWAQYWKIVRYGDILDNKMYWNRLEIPYGKKDWMDAGISNNFFQEVYPCQLKFPVPTDRAGQNSREADAAFYQSNERDKAVFLTDHFMRLIPSKWGLGKYNNPIWVRFVVASDYTILYAEPMCYCPIVYMGYDPDNLRSRNSSLALEVLPFQDIVGNVLSQILLTCKQNLANLILYDINVLDKQDIDKLKNQGELLYRAMNLIGYDSFKNKYAGVDIAKAIHQIQFQSKDVQPLYQSLSATLAMLERLLQISSQEAGGAASHQQSKAEVEMIGGSSSNRVMYTGSGIDDGLGAMKRQLYHASVAYMDDEVEAYVNADIPDITEVLKRVGFDAVGEKSEGKYKVKGNKRHIRIDDLAVTGKTADQKTDGSVAQVMMQAIQAIANNQFLAQSVGAKPLLKGMEAAARLAGADKDFKMRPDLQQQMNQLQQMAQQIQQAAVKQIEQDVSKPAAQEMAKLQHEVEQLSQMVNQIMQKLSQPPTPNAGQPQIVPPIPTGAPPVGAGGPAPQMAG